MVYKIIFSPGNIVIWSNKVFNIQFSIDFHSVWKSWMSKNIWTHNLFTNVSSTLVENMNAITPDYSHQKHILTVSFDLRKTTDMIKNNYLCILKAKSTASAWAKDCSVLKLSRAHKYSAHHRLSMPPGTNYWILQAFLHPWVLKEKNITWLQNMSPVHRVTAIDSGEWGEIFTKQFCKYMQRN